MSSNYSDFELNLVFEAIVDIADIWTDVRSTLKDVYPLTYWFETQGKYNYAPKFN